MEPPPRNRFRESVLLRGARYRSKKSGIPCNIEIVDIFIPDRCPILGFKLRFHPNRQRHDSPTLDRVIPELGYTKGNVVVVSDLANRIKSNGTPLEVLRVAKFYLKLLKES